jgi:hypothetical protein
MIMKKLFSILLIIFCSTLAYSQTNTVPVVIRKTPAPVGGQVLKYLSSRWQPVNLAITDVQGLQDAIDGRAVLTAANNFSGNNNFIGKNKFFNADTSQIEIGISNTQKMSIRHRPGTTEFWGRNDQSETVHSFVFNGNITAQDFGATNIVASAGIETPAFRLSTGAADGLWMKSINSAGDVIWAQLPDFQIPVGDQDEITVSANNQMALNLAAFTSIAADFTTNQRLRMNMFPDTEWSDFVSGTITDGNAQAVTGNVVYDYLTGNYQPLDADLTSWAAIVRAAGFNTFAATPTSANFAATITDETGTGAVVLGTSPTITTSLNVNGDLAVTNDIRPSLYNPNDFRNAKGLGLKIIAEPLAVGFRDVRSTHSMVDGSCRCTIAYYAKDTTLTGLGYLLTNTPSITADNNNKFALFSVNVGALTAARVAESTNSAAHFTGTGATIKEIPFTAPYAATAGYYLHCYLYNVSAAATPPIFGGATQSELFNNSLMFSTGITTNYSISGQTDMPTTIDLSTASKTNHAQYVWSY